VAELPPGGSAAGLSERLRRAEQLRELARLRELIAEDGMLTTGEVMLLFNVTAVTVYNWQESGGITSVLTPGGHRRYPASQFAELTAEDSMLATGDVMLLLHINQRAVRLLRDKGDIASVRTPGGHCRYPASQFAGLSSGRAAAPAAGRRPVRARGG
jgi:DNA-binding transcriptional MerR regulator